MPNITYNLPDKERTTEVFFDNTTREKIRKHLSDFNDIITEQDLKNVKTEMTVIPLEAIG
ncbi:MAG: hypothetical protein ABIT07_08455 [Ferruginibacter sp.]